MGYLVCDKCGGSYELQEGESPDDYGKCECGGNLNYSEKLENEIISPIPSQNKNLILINWRLIIIAVIVCFILQIFISFILTMIGLPIMAISIFVNYIFTILIGMYIGFSVNLNPKNGLINGLLAGFTAGTINFIFEVGTYIFMGYGTPFKLLAALVTYILLFGIGGIIGGLWKNHQLKTSL